MSTEWSHEWDAETGALRLMRGGCCYSSLLQQPPGGGKDKSDTARRATRYLFDLCSGLLDEGHGWCGGGEAETRAVIAMAHRALGDVLGGMPMPTDEGRT